jgi:AraC family transcriptional regulator
MMLCAAVFGPNHGAIVSTAQLVVAVHKSAPYELRWREGRHKKKRIVRSGAIHISPVGVPTYLEWGEARPEVTAITIDQTMVLRIVENAGMNPATSLPTALAIRDPMIRQLAEACEKEMNANNDRPFMESLVTTLVTHIYRTYTRAGVPIIVKGGLTPKQTARVLAYVREHMSENIGVDELAAEVGLSGNHFTDTFKRTMGVTPYKYLLNQRTEKAKELLKQGKLPLAKIAELVGFSSPAKLSTHFRKIVGITPAQFRRESL